VWTEDVKIKFRIRIYPALHGHILKRSCSRDDETFLFDRLLDVMMKSIQEVFWIAVRNVLVMEALVRESRENMKTKDKRRVGDVAYQRLEIPKAFLFFCVVNQYYCSSM